MGIDAYIVNHKTKKLFIVRNFFDTVTFRDAVISDSLITLLEGRYKQDTNNSSWLYWFNNTLINFTKLASPEEIEIVHDNDYGGPWFYLEDEGYEIVGSQWDFIDGAKI